MDSPRVTVLMTVYNCEAFIRPSIKSVLQQTYRNFELLIIDDGSTDGTMEIVKKFKDERIRILKNPTNRGVAYSRKKALLSSKGEFVAILDADDISLPDRLRRQVEYLDGNPSVALIGASNYVIDDDGNIIDRWVAPKTMNIIRWKLLFGNCFCHSTVMFRRLPAISVGGYDDSVFAGEDYDLYVRLAAKYELANIEAILVSWRRTVTGLGRVEPFSVKDHFVQTVIKSIRMQTGSAVSLDVARCLFTGIPKSAQNRRALKQAFVTIVNCCDIITRRFSIGTEEKKELVIAALEEVLRISKQNKLSYTLACRAALRCLMIFHKGIIINSAFIKIFIPFLRNYHRTS
jgi:glycosyltransferase involved in cell wall biosynthesis